MFNLIMLNQKFVVYLKGSIPYRIMLLSFLTKEFTVAVQSPKSCQTDGNRLTLYYMGLKHDWNSNDMLGVYSNYVYFFVDMCVDANL
jgi:hypothetical protein